MKKVRHSIGEVFLVKQRSAWDQKRFDTKYILHLNIIWSCLKLQVAVKSGFEYFEYVISPVFFPIFISLEMVLSVGSGEAAANDCAVHRRSSEKTAMIKRKDLLNILSPLERWWNSDCSCKNRLSCCWAMAERTLSSCRNLKIFYRVIQLCFYLRNPRIPLV